MALSDKNLIITPNIGSDSDPKIIFSGADASTTAQNISLNVYPTNSGTISFEGSSGQLFSITNSLTGTIFSVNDVSGIPSIEVLDTGLVKIAQYSGNILLGTAIDDTINKLQVGGSITGTVLKSTIASGTSPFNVTSPTLVTNLNADLLDGQQGTYYYQSSNPSGYTTNAGTVTSVGGTGTVSGLTLSGTVTGSGNLTLGGAIGTLNQNTTGSSGSCTGNADTATTTTYQYCPDGDRNPATKLPTDGGGHRVRFDFCSAGTTGTSGNYSGVMTYAPWDGTSESTGDSSYQLGFGNQSGVNASGPPALVIRNGINSSWNDWYRIITSANIGSQSVSYADSAGSADKIDGVNFRNTDVSSPTNANTIDSNGISFVNSNVQLFGQTDGALYSQAHNSVWQHQIYGDYRTGKIATRGKLNGDWQRWRYLPTIDISDTAPTVGLIGGDFWWESDTGKLKIYYTDTDTSQWVDAFPVPDMSTYYSKGGGAITGPVTINSQLNVSGNIYSDSAIIGTNITAEGNVIGSSASCTGNAVSVTTIQPATASTYGGAKFSLSGNTLTITV